METDNYLIETINCTHKKIIFDLLNLPAYLSRFERNMILGNWDQFFQNFSASNNFSWVIFTKKTKKMVGIVMFHNYIFSQKTIEFGVCIHPNYWRKGILSEIFPFLINWVQFEISPIEIKATIEEKNIIAQTAALSLGFHLCTKTAKNEPGDKHLYHVYALLVNK